MAPSCNALSAVLRRYEANQGTGNLIPNKNLEDRTVDELQNLAAELEIDGRGKIKKAESVEAVPDARG